MWGALIPVVGSLIGGLIGGKKSKDAGNQAAGGARLQQLMPQIVQLLQQQQQINAQNYGMKTQQYAANQPLQDAIRRMALGMMPSMYQQGPASMSAPPQAVMPPAPAPTAPQRGGWAGVVQRAKQHQ